MTSLNAFVRVVRQQIPTTSGTQDFTFAGLGTCKAVIVTLVRCATDGTVESEVGWSIGFTDGSNSYCTVNASSDNLADTNTSKSATMPLAAIINSTHDGYDVVGEYGGFITDGVRINWAAVDGIAHYCIVTLFSGDDLQAHVNDFNMPDNTGVPNSTMDVTSPGFVPNCLFVLGGANFDNGSSDPEAGQSISFGMAVDATPKPVTAHFGYTHGDNKATTTPSISVTQDDIIHRTVRDNATSTSLAKFNPIKLSAFIANGFRVLDPNGGNPPKVAYLAIRFGTAKPEIQEITTPTSPGTVATGKVTQAGIIFQTMTDVIGSADRSDDSAGQLGLGFFSRENSYSFCQHEEDAAATTNNGTVCDDIVVHVPLHDGTTGLKATVGSFTTDTTFTYSDVLGTARKTLVLLFPTAIFEATSVPLTAPRFQAAATGEEVFDAAAALTSPKFQCAATAELIFDSSCALTSPKFTAASSGEEVFDCTSALTSPRFTASAQGQLVFDATAALTVAKFQAAALAELVFEAASALTVPKFQCQATAELVFDATAALVSPKFSAAATGELVFDAQATLTVQRFSVSAAGELVFEATCQITLPSFQCQATDAAPLGCIVELLGSMGGLTLLEGSRDAQALLEGSSNRLSDLSGGLDAARSLDGSYDAVKDLRGANC